MVMKVTIATAAIVQSDIFYRLLRYTHKHISTALALYVGENDLYIGCDQLAIVPLFQSPAVHFFPRKARIYMYD